MPGLMEKARAIGLSPSNVATYASIRAGNVLGRLFGTLRLKAKALLFGVSLGAGVTAHGPVGLSRWPGSRIVLGDRVSVISSWRRATACALSRPARLRTFSPAASIVIGEGCELSGTSITCRSTSITLGKNVMVAPDVIMVDSDFHAPWPVEARKTDPGWDRDRPVTVGDNAWIGMGSIILKGVTIGEGAIIGAGSVVTRDIPPYAVAAGVPARVVSRRDAKGEKV